MIKNNKLTIFENLVVDKNLPKYKIVEKKSDTNNIIINSGSVFVPYEDDFSDTIGTTLAYEAFVKQTLLSKIKLWVYNKIFNGGKRNKKTMFLN